METIELKEIEMDLKSRSVAMMKILRAGTLKHIRLHASGRNNIRYLEKLLFAIGKWIFVHEIVNETPEPNKEQLSVVFSRSHDFGLKFMHAKAKA